MRLVAGRPLRRLGVVGIVTLVFAGSAFAVVCHPDFPGTRSLPVAGHVDSYSMRGGRVTIAATVNGCERRIDWRPLAATATQGRCTSAGPLSRGDARSATDGRFRVVLERGSALPDRPDRLIVYDARTGAALHRWPLPASASTVDVARGVAALSTSNGVYAVRLRDGQFALVGVKRPHDYPKIEAPGIVYQDDLYKRRAAKRSLLKFVPFSSVTHALRPFGPLRVPVRIGDFSLDGRSVLFVKKDPTGECDRIGVWTIPWHYTTDLMDEPPFCPERHAPGGITALALGGQYLEVVTTYGKVQTLISSTFIRCIEKVVTRTRLGASSIAEVAADGQTLAYAVTRNAGPTRVGRVHGLNSAGSTVVSSAARLSVDRGRVAVLRRDGSVDVLEGNRVLRTFAATRARAIALRGDQLVVLTRRTLDVYGLLDGRLLHSWRVPAGTSAAVDVHYGVAVLTAGRTVLAVRLATGHRRGLLTAPQPVRAQLDDVGAVYAYNVGRSGVLGFIPFAQIERALAS
jgi:hypothetical protein